MRESWGNNWIEYFYDENGSPTYCLRYDENDGDILLNFYITNLQGDVIAVCDNTHVPRFFYHYDAWGKLLSVTNTNGDDVTNATNAASWNSLRYRGYVYDRETGLYYLNSRYYDPETGRFISADGVISDVGGVIQGNNMYTYCFNNPVNMTDANGNWPNWDKLVKGALLVTIGALAVAAVVSTGGACAPLVALGYSALGTAGAALTIIGSSEVGESITGANPIKESIGEDTYDTIRDASLAVVSMGGTLLDAGANAVCFVAGTEIRTDIGEVAIEDVAAGAIVWAMNPDTGEVALKKVTRTFVKETDELIHVKVSGEEIICTPSHPFYSPVKGWTKAVDLRAGDILVRLNGTYIIVEQVQHELLETSVRVYNFEVADFHTYYVGRSAVLVHNTCGGNSSSRGVGGKGWVGDKTWRENVSTVGNGGTITSLNGGVPTKAQAMQLINQSGGTPLRIEAAHQFPNPHNYTHINYVTSCGVKGTIKIFE